MDALGSGLFYAGVVTTLVGLFSLIRPLRWVGIRTRRRGVLVATFGAVLGLGTTVLPPWSVRPPLATCSSISGSRNGSLAIPRAARPRYPGGAVRRDPARSVV